MMNITPSSVNQMNYSLKELQDIFSAMNSSIIVAITDRTGKITFVNDHFCKISKYTREELVGQDHRLLNSGFHPKSFFREMWKTIGNGDMWNGEVCNRAKDGSLYWVKTTIIPFLDERGKPYQYIAIRVDITAQKDIKKITHIAYHDELTGLPNRRKLEQRLENEFHQSRRTGEKFALFFIDVNRFKHINDGLGHIIGDMFLVEMSNRLRNIDHTSNSFYRHNSDEFVMILNDVSRIEEMAKEIISVFNESFIVDTYEFYASISIGISIFPDHANSVEELLKNADIAMYAAKSTRGNQYRLYRDNMDEANDKWLLLETKLHQALKQDRLELHYQPKIDLKTDSVIGMEALLRWYDPVLGHIPPDRFIPFAEDCGLINDIGVWVLRKACAQARQWNEAHELSLRVAVNISPIHISTGGFVDMVRSVIAETGIDPNLLEIEITEMSMLDYTEDLIDTIKQLRELGITISLDDFGTGYSSLNYLKKFPVDVLKIDRAFVRDIVPEKSGIAMISAMISLAHALNLQVVAEGVEEEAELNVLREHGCEYVQGYYFSKPLSVGDFTNLIVNTVTNKSSY
ncbi:MULTISPECIES: putative bifunctional diguanylate cyclase/phosphodiesterase [Lysinibacillus]|uniref:putative bifunctional diguanylate cyclase/phosphodiesterase n=1 Tax=Lysinibacillus TaxID=400634 RepID=UPI0021048F7F|nr:MULTISPECIES: GGDEF domain-containing phosphodiesterase [Lysinibacillus]WHP42803.1 EAL domain-containing protein [Lysinibacillus boronitolerans]MBX8945431.1 EAL domain-containing protein [Lysinibacillus sp. K60]UUV26864.1 EAL domain-containing protein [Lysinibacillus sp. FN11]UYB49756.1 EAL domain-containing protein [Lysinibacillus capsici]WDU81745.1 EAL domain-containing protein [Lysinibacillus sp. G01H]